MSGFDIFFLCVLVLVCGFIILPLMMYLWGRMLAGGMLDSLREYFRKTKNNNYVKEKKEK